MVVEMCAGIGKPPLRVLLVEDSPLLQELLGEMLTEIDNVEIAAQAMGESEALDQLASAAFDLAIVDIELNEGSGMGVLRQLREAPERFCKPRTIVFSSHGQPAIRRHCAALGAEAFFDKANGMDELLDFVEIAAAQE